MGLLDQTNAPTLLTPSRSSCSQCTQGWLGGRVTTDGCEEEENYVEIKCQLDATDGFFIADLIGCSTCFGHHYAHHQELKSFIWVVAACGIWCFGFQVVVVV